MMKKSSKIIIAALATLGIAGTVFAKGEHCGYGGNMEKRAQHVHKKISKKLDLNEAQKLELSALQQKVQAKISAVRSNKAEKKEAMMGLFGETFDQNQAITLLQERTTKMNNNAPEMVAAFAKFYDSLNAEQQEKLRSFIKRKGGRGLMGFGFGGHHKSWGKGQHADS